MAEQSPSSSPNQTVRSEHSPRPMSPVKSPTKSGKPKPKRGK